MGLPNSEHYNIARGMGWVLLFILIGKVPGLLKEIAVASRYGTNQDLDAYFLLFNVVNWAPVLLYIILTKVLVPFFSSTRSSEAESFYNEAVGAAIIFGICLTAATALILPIILHLEILNIPKEARGQALSLSVILSVTCFFSVIFSLLSSRLMAMEKHGNTLMESMLPVGILICFGMLHHDRTIFPLYIGTVLGFVLQSTGLWAMARHAGIRSTPRFTFKSSCWRKLWTGAKGIFFAQLFISLTRLIDPIMASYLGEGAVSSLSYAYRLLYLIIGVGGLAVGRAILPVLSRLSANRNAAYFLARKWAMILLTLGLCVVFFVWFASPWFIRVLLERGSFSSGDTKDVVSIFRWGLVQIPFVFASHVMLQYLISTSKYAALSKVAFLMLCVKIIANMLFLSWIGVAGLAFSNGIMYFVALVLYCMLASGQIKEAYL